MCEAPSLPELGEKLLESPSLKVRVVPGAGMNIAGIAFCGRELIRCDPRRMQAGSLWGAPPLYPTPNRVASGAFRFEGRRYPARMHGIAHRAAFSSVRTGRTGRRAWAEGRLPLRPGEPLYEEFPFESELRLRIELNGGTLTWAYRLRNQGRRPLPFGIGLHPFWKRIGPVSVQVNAASFMETDGERIPTGKILPVEGRPWDLRTPRSVDNLDLDHVYRNRNEKKWAVVRYLSEGILLSLRASPEFGHFVTYIPRGRDFFCLENQSCSPDAHNLFAKGHEEASGLRVLAPGEESCGAVIMEFQTFRPLGR